MNFGELFKESIAYSQETFQGHWTRWLIFVLLALPMALFPFVFDMTKITDGTTIHWELVPWGQVAAVLVTGFILYLFISGYTVRIYRGVKPAPDFDDWGNLFVDGLKLTIVTLIWVLPLAIVLLFVLGLSFASLSAMGAGSMGLFFGLLLLGLLIELAIFVIVVIFSPMGVVRFARTGSIREGLRVSKIAEHIGTIGWGQYIIALVILFVAMIIFAFLSMLLSLIPVIGWLIRLVITPLFTVFFARYYTILYEQGGQQTVPV
jgi:hypothetical protein